MSIADSETFSFYRSMKKTHLEVFVTLPSTFKPPASRMARLIEGHYVFAH